MIAVTTLNALQWAGCFTSVVGALLLAVRTRHSGVGFTLLLMSSLLWLIYAVKTEALGLAVNQIFFILINLIGIYTWLIVPTRAKANAKHKG